MKHRFLMSVAAAALIAGTGWPKPRIRVVVREVARHPARATPQRRIPHRSGVGSQRSFETTPVPGSERSGSRAESDRGPDHGMKSSQSDQRPGERNQRAQDQSPGQKSNMRSDSRDNSKAGQGLSPRTATKQRDM